MSILYKIIYVYVYSVCLKVNPILVCPKNYIIFFAFNISHMRDVHCESVGITTTIYDCQNIIFLFLMKVTYIGYICISLILY